MDTKRVFVDTSFFKAVIDERDDFYAQAMSILLKLQKNKVEMLTSNFILDESYTLIRVRCSLQLAIKFREYMSEGLQNLRLNQVSFGDEIEAWSWFVNDWGKKLSFTDCTSFAVMKRLELKDVATFDQHFARAGFTIFK